MTDVPKTFAERLAETIASRVSELQDYDHSISIHEAAIAEIDADHVGCRYMAECRVQLEGYLEAARVQRGMAQLLMNAEQAKLAAL